MEMFLLFDTQPCQCANYQVWRYMPVQFYFVMLFHALQAIEMLSGKKPLPWEDEDGANYASDMKSMGFMKGAIIKMLSRDPANRPQLVDVQRQWQSILETERTFTALSGTL